MAAYVKCYYCGERFDRESQPFVKVTARRYAHKECEENKKQILTKEEQDKIAFWETVKSIYGKDYNYMMIKRQVEGFQKEFKYTFSGMAKSLNYFYTIKNGSVEDSNGGVGIIPYVYDEARDYYYKIYVGQNINKSKKIEQEVKEIEIQTPQVWRQPPHLLDF